jgi:hypothetical protein
LTAEEQEKLYASLKLHHPDWTDQFCSGYVSGVMDESIRTKPNPLFTKRRANLDHYALGYLTGFAVHRGSDVETEPWFNFVGLLVKGLRDETSDKA